MMDVKIGDPLNRIGVVIAMKKELEPFLKIYSPMKIELTNGELYLKDICGKPYVFLCSGIGRTNAAAAAAALIAYGCSKIINIGTCGCTYTEPVFGTNGTKFIPEPGQIWVPEHFFDGDFDLSVFGNYSKDPAEVNRFLDPIPRSPQAPRIFTVSKFATEPIAEGGYLVDMESYGCLAACAFYDTEFQAIKVITDSAGKDADKEFSKKLPTLDEVAVKIGNTFFT